MTPSAVNRILFGGGERQRFTQDTPILPEVWYEFGLNPRRRHDLLITPLDSMPANRLLRDLVRSMDPGALVAAAPVALRGFVAIRLSFDELVDLILPRTVWAQEAGQFFTANPDLFQATSEDRLRTTRTRDLGEAQRFTPHGSGFENYRILRLVDAILRDQQQESSGSVKVGRPRARAAPDTGGPTAVLERIGARLAEAGTIWRVSMNRRLNLSDETARTTVKADAAVRVFDVKAGSITWAVVDSGIDDRHPAFNKDGICRVKGSYDLASLRQLLNAGFQDDPGANPQLAIACAASGTAMDDGLALLTKAYLAYETDVLDWSSIEPLIRLQAPPPPTDGHGTHVAGIIGADWREADGTPIVVGLCPDINLLDLRILSSHADDTEFAVIAALQFIRYLNGRNDFIEVHGINLSLSIPHVVENYACGRTPICDECERLVGAGVTVVAAAGNQGYHGYATARGMFSNYATLSITDPGNAECVITVGATHKREPHTYGVSYFSSRGPTGDGRAKPDLVAPGERIRSTLPHEKYGPLDGTSQAAPHVSAAAAMLMARFPELIGQPRRIKQLLCESATDLGRERAFQGHGLLDTLRALQSF